MLTFHLSKSIPFRFRFSSPVLKPRHAPFCTLSPPPPSKLPSPTSSSSSHSPPALPSPALALITCGFSLIVLKRGKATLFRTQRNPIVFGNSISHHITPPNQPLTPCAPVAVCNGTYDIIGMGVYNPHSMYRVRILEHYTTGRMEHWQVDNVVERKVKEAVEVRKAIGLGNEHTDVYRVINGEGDGLGGLVVDRVGKYVVVMTSALWCEKYKTAILTAIRQWVGEHVIWRKNLERLRQDGWQDIEDEVKEEEENVNEHIQVKEEGVLYEIGMETLKKGQKTGHYADQRETRTYIRTLIERMGRELDVLDLYCYSGGFGLNAALAREDVRVTGVDMSETALIMARRNAELNNVDDRMEFIRADVTKWMKETDKLYDMVIVDPPKFAPSTKVVNRAKHKYRGVNGGALKRVKNGGILVTCSCSAAMKREQGEFVEMVRMAGMQVGKEVKLIAKLGASSDHVIAPEYTEGDYLTACVFVVHSV